MNESTEPNNIDKLKKHDKDISDKQAHFSALWGLIASKKYKLETCPTAQELALLIDGQLPTKMRNQMLAHLNECDICRSIWLETATYLDTKPKLQKAATKHNLIGKISQYLTPGPLMITGMAAMILLLVIVFPGSGINHKIDSQYQILLSENGAEAVSVANTLTMPWENSSLSFAKPVDALEKKAFAAGLWQGKNQIVSSSKAFPKNLNPPRNTNWQDSEWANYYQFGRFVALLWIETHLKSGSKDWERHQQILKILHENFSKQQAKNELTQSMLTSLSQIQEKLERLKNSPSPSVIEAKPLQRFLEIVMQKYNSG